MRRSPSISHTYNNKLQNAIPKMPYSRRKRPSTKPFKKTYRKGNKPIASKAAYRKANRGLTGGLGRLSVRADPFPVTKFCRLVYDAPYTLSTGTAGVLGSSQVFRLNSIYDPNFTGAGHQPYGHDQLALIYKQYKVHGVHIHIELLDPSEDGMCGVFQVVTPQNAAQPTISGQVGQIVAESPFTVLRNINDSGKQRVVYSQYLPMSRIIGLTPLQFKASSGAPYSAVFGTNPQDSPYLRIAVGSNRGTSGATMVVQCRLTYYTQCFERVRMTDS